MDWKNSFDRRTLQEGWRMEQAGRVGPLYRDGEIYSAVVDGRYLVQAQIEGGEILSIECSCPAGQAGNLCAHEAAFLFKAEGTGSLDSLPSRSRPVFDSLDHDFQKEHPQRPVDPQLEKPKAPCESENEGEDDFSGLLRRLMEATHAPKDDRPAPKREDDFNPSPKPNSAPSPIIEAKPEPVERQEENVEDAKPEKERTSEKPETVNETPVDDEEEGPKNKPEVHAKPVFPPSPKPLPEQLIETMDPQKLKAFVLDYARRKPEFEDALFMTLLPEDEQVAERLEKKALFKADQLLKEAAAHPERPADCKDLFAWIDEQIDQMVGMNEEYPAIRLLESVVEHTASHPHPFSLEATRKLDRFCLNRLLDLVRSMQDESLVEEVFSWAEEHQEQKDLSLIDKDLLSLLLDEIFSRPSLLSVQLEIMDRDLQKTESESGTIWEKEDAWKKAAGLLERADLPLSTRQKFENRYGMNPQLLIERAGLQLKKGEAQRALHSLELADRLRCTPSQMVAKARMKAEAFGKLGQDQDEKEQLKTLAFLYLDHRQHELERLIELSDSNELEDLYTGIDQKVDPELRARLYRDRKESDRLFTLMEKEGTLDLMLSVQAFLNTADPKRTARLWLTLAKRQMDHPAGNTDYRLIAYALSQAASQPETKPEAKTVAEQLRKAHPRSRALLMVLDQAGL